MKKKDDFDLNQVHFEANNKIAQYGSNLPASGSVTIIQGNNVVEVYFEKVTEKGWRLTGHERK